MIKFIISFIIMATSPHIGFRHTCRLYPELNTYSDTKIYKLYRQDKSCISNCPVSQAVWNQRWLSIFKIICIIPINICLFYWLSYDISPISIIFSINIIIFIWIIMVEGYFNYSRQLEIQNNPIVIQELQVFQSNFTPT